MAQINLQNIKKVEKKRNTIHEKVCTTYTFFEMSGKKYIQFDMYGKIDRENPEKISQTIQIDCDSAQNVFQSVFYSKRKHLSKSFSTGKHYYVVVNGL